MHAAFITAAWLARDVSWPGPLIDVGGGMHEIPADYEGVDGGLRMNVPGRIVASGEVLTQIKQDDAAEQVANVATLPGIVGYSLAMPDIHQGYGFPIGGVAAFDPDPVEGPVGVVSPGGVGFDINCGVRLLRTDLDIDSVRPRLRETLDALFAAVPAGMGRRGGTGVAAGDLANIMAGGMEWAVENGHAHAEDARHMEEDGRIEGAAPEHVSERALTRGRRTLGSLGSGNHFLELQVVDRTWDEAACKAFGVHEGQVLLMVHTGSRGLGHEVCQDFVGQLQSRSASGGADHGIPLVDRQLACAPLDSPQAERYLGAMAAAANFAFVNRSIVAQHARATLKGLFGAEAEVVYDVCHNIAKWEEHTIPAGPDAGKRRRLCVHRKGATRAFGPDHPDVPAAYRAVGQPVIVPGDMGRMSFLLAGQRGAEERTFGSCCHGAGRRMSRTQAKKEYQGEALVRQLGEQGIIVRATTPVVAAEEAPLAYKDVSQVVDSVELAGLAKKVARLRPLGVVKG